MAINLEQFETAQTRIKEAVERVERLRAFLTRLDEAEKILFDEAEELGLFIDEPDADSEYPIVQWRIDGLRSLIGAVIRDCQDTADEEYRDMQRSLFWGGNDD